MKIVIPIALASLVAACVSATLRPAGGGWGDAPAVTADDYSLQDAAQFGLTGQESLDEAAAIIQSRLQNPPNEPVEGNYKETINVYSGEIIGLPRGAVVMTRENLSDDAARSVQDVIEFNVSKETQAASVTAYGTRYQCWRVSNPDRWTNRPCP
ncbi:hypothetical protein FNJ84_09255 [Paracoccus sp. M683]|uniref:hypothetical protein n=1 Tax=Paracoccus sp. M683 TaxID=2594268 RepID=UPI001180C686|nr:hypothetical protein [Paracoccus sp. M683]TRW97669.1 hypothetical protein FNJ84_09255 [Paracoccus sp. M683]